MLARAKRSGSQANKQDTSLCFLTDTIKALDWLSGPAKSEQLLEQRYLMIAEAAA